MKGYNGWKNYETWNVSLWLTNDEFLYNVARTCATYQDFVEVALSYCPKAATPDDVSYADPAIAADELNELVFSEF